MVRIGAYTVDEAREFKALLLQLRAAGFVLQGGQKKQAVIEGPQEVIFHNSSGATAPPFAPLQVIACNINGSVPIVEVDQVADSYGRSGPYVFNGPLNVANDEKGIGYRGYVAVQGDATTYVFGDRLRVKASAYTVEKHPCGNLFCLGKYELRAETDIYLAMDVGYPQTIQFKAASGIAARSGTTTITKGSASCDIWTSNGTVGQIADSTFDETIYSLFTQAIPSNAFGVAALDSTGEWNVLNWEQDCPVTDIRLDGSSLQQKRCGTWETWETVTDCP